MAWSADYKKNTFASYKGMKIKDRADHNKMREYYAALNGHTNGKSHASETNSVRRMLFNGAKFDFRRCKTPKAVAGNDTPKLEDRCASEPLPAKHFYDKRIATNNRIVRASYNSAFADRFGG